MQCMCKEIWWFGWQNDRPYLSSIDGRKASLFGSGVWSETSLSSWDHHHSIIIIIAIIIIINHSSFIQFQICIFCSVYSAQSLEIMVNMWTSRSKESRWARGIKEENIVLCCPVQFVKWKWPHTAEKKWRKTKTKKRPVGIKENKNEKSSVSFNQMQFVTFWESSVQAGTRQY